MCVEWACTIHVLSTMDRAKDNDRGEYSRSEDLIFLLSTWAFSTVNMQIPALMVVVMVEKLIIAGFDSCANKNFSQLFFLLKHYMKCCEKRLLLVFILRKANKPIGITSLILQHYSRLSINMRLRYSHALFKLWYRSATGTLLLFFVPMQYQPWYLHT